MRRAMIKSDQKPALSGPTIYCNLISRGVVHEMLGTCGTIRGTKSRVVEPLAIRFSNARDRKGIERGSRVDSWPFVTERRDPSNATSTLLGSAYTSGARGDIAGRGRGNVGPSDRDAPGPRSINGKSRAATHRLITLCGTQSSALKSHPAKCASILDAAKCSPRTSTGRHGAAAASNTRANPSMISSSE